MLIIKADSCQERIFRSELKSVSEGWRSILSRFYKGISDQLREPQKMKLLKRLKEENETDLIEYCTILMSNEKDEEAFKELESIILSEHAMWNPEINLVYLEKEKLFPEAVDFIKSGRISEYLAFDFYKRNKKYVPEDAERYPMNFAQIINEELA